MNKFISSVILSSLSLCFLAGCGSSNTGSTNTGAAVSQEAATATASEAAAIATSMTETQTSTSSGAMAAKVDVSGCPTVDVKSTGQGGAWTDELLTFIAPPCEFSGPRGYNTLDITGTLELTRSAGDAYNFTSDANNLEWAFTSGSSTYSESRTGTRAITASASGASAASNMSIVFAGAVHNGTFTHQMAATFTPGSGLSLASGEPLPSGNFTYTGSAQWAGSDGNSGTFGITTITPLAYDSTCKDTEPSVFDSGEIHVHLTSDSGKAYAKVTWSDCGAPVVSFVAD